MRNRRNALWLCIPILWLLAGASSPQHGNSLSADDSTAVSVKQGIRLFERSFKPSQYEPDPIHGVTFQAAIAVPETVQGFRVQLLSTNEYDEAMLVRTSLEQYYPDTWIYTVYEAPTYKVRIGDYMTRGDAAMMLDSLSARGQKGAWIVPDRVIKNPPPKPPRPAPADSVNTLLR
jgi:hypothetical protein